MPFTAKLSLAHSLRKISPIEVFSAITSLTIFSCSLFFPVQFCASMWTEQEAEQILSIARSVKPDIKTHVIPHGLQVERGPDAIVEHLVEQIPKLLG